MALPVRVSDLVGFDLLLSVAEQGSIGRAAVAHGISQPAASARLRRLERTVGAPLLERSTRGARLTTSGQLVASWAQPVMDRAADLEAGIAALRADRNTHLQVAASLTVAEYLLPRWLIALRAVDPGVVAALSSGNSADVSEQVLRGEVDLGFIESPELAAGLACREVGRDELAVVVDPGHPWAARRRRRPAELAATPLVSREHGSGTRQAWGELCGRRSTVNSPRRCWRCRRPPRSRPP